MISSVEGSLGIPDPTSMAGKDDDEEGKIVSKLADGKICLHHCCCLYACVIVAIDAVEHDVPIHDCDLEEDENVPKGGEKMVRDEPHPSSSPTTSFWNSLGTIASSVQSTVSNTL